MIKLIVATLLSGIGLASYAQKRFIIHGHIDLPTKSRNVRLSGYDPVQIKPDGTFEITGEKNEPNIALLMTDCSASTSIWLAPGEYTIHCKEIMLPNYKSAVFRTPFLQGPADAVLFNVFTELQYNGYGTAKRAIQFMDSVLKINNGSPVLPGMIRSVQPFIGDEATQMLMQKLAPELKNSGEMVMLDQNFKRKDKIKKEKAFENFTLKNVSDSNFSLSSLSGKKVILIDFWASSCGACRADHPRLKQWYAKYAARGLEIVSISIDNNKAKWLKAVHDDGIENWINVCDPNGFKASLMQDYYIPFIPFLFLLDKNRNIILVNNWQDSWITEKDIIAMLDK